MKEASITSIADGFMAEWLALEESAHQECSCDAKVVLVNRMVQLFSWYIIEKLLDEAYGTSPASSEAEERLLHGRYSSRIIKIVIPHVHA